MSLERENILNLIGDRRYHSCVLTTFSFDFCFFEMKVMKRLRSSGVRNVNVLIDGNYYSELMNQITGEEMWITPGYSLYPIFTRSIFHPKLWILFGEKEGLLIIGSGNLTNSGIGNNDEIWGAFHFDIRSRENISLFSSACHYVLSLCSNIVGQMNEKTTTWIIEQAAWIQDLPKTPHHSFSKIRNGESIALLFNSQITSIWQQLSDHLYEEKITEIACIAPFYDKDGKTLQELASLYPAAKIKVALDENGLIPTDMKPGRQINFYSWSEVFTRGSEGSRMGQNVPKLHGKILHFRSTRGVEYCFFGSANITASGLGINGAKKANVEAGLFIKTDRGNLLDELGIRFNDQGSKKLSDFQAKQTTSIFDTIARSNSKKIKLLSAEMAYDELTVYSSGNISDRLCISFFDKHGEFIGSQELAIYQEELKIKVEYKPDTIRFVQIANSAYIPVSNKLLVTDYFLIARTHPNPKTEDIERIYSEIQGGELSKVLDLLYYAIIDKEETEEDNRHSNANLSTKRTIKKSIQNLELFDLSSYKSHVRSGSERNLLFSSRSLRVLDVIKFVNNGAEKLGHGTDIDVNEQKTDVNAIENNSGNHTKAPLEKPHSALKSETGKLIHYFDNLYDHQQNILHASGKSYNNKLTLTDLTKYLIAIELILEYGGKTQKYSDNKNQRFFQYLPYSNGSYYNDSVTGCCLNLIGDFLMLSSRGFKKYDFEYTTRKIEELKSEALVTTIFCLINNYWSENEIHYLNTMLLNCLHYLGSKDFHQFESTVNELKVKIDKREIQAKRRVRVFESNKEYLFQSIIPAFSKVIKEISEKKFSSSTVAGRIIYKSPFGYCYVHSISRTNDFSLIRPGFMWDEHREDYMKYNADTVATTINLPSFIVVDI